MTQSSQKALDLQVLPLRDVVVFPYMVIPLFVGREKSMRALEKAMDADKRILLVAQKRLTLTILVWLICMPSVLMLRCCSC